MYTFWMFWMFWLFLPVGHSVDWLDRNISKNDIVGNQLKCSKLKTPTWKSLVFLFSNYIGIYYLTRKSDLNKNKCFISDCNEKLIKCKVGIMPPKIKLIANVFPIWSSSILLVIFIVHFRKSLFSLSGFEPETFWL